MTTNLWPGWTLRLLLAAEIAAILGLLKTNGAASAILALLILFAAAAVYMPASIAPATFIGGSAVAIFLSTGNPLSPGVLALIPLFHLTHITSAIAGLLPKDARIDPRALIPAARRYLLIQAAVLPFLVITMFLPKEPLPPVLEAAGLLACLALVAVVIRRLSRVR